MLVAEGSHSLVTQVGARPAVTLACFCCFEQVQKSDCMQGTTAAPCAIAHKPDTANVLESCVPKTKRCLRETEAGGSSSKCTSCLQSSNHVHIYCMYILHIYFIYILQQGHIYLVYILHMYFIYILQQGQPSSQANA